MNIKIGLWNSTEVTKQVLENKKKNVNFREWDED